MPIKPTTQVFTPYMAELFPEAAKTGIYSVQAIPDDRAVITSSEFVLRPPPDARDFVSASFALGGGIGQSSRYRGGRPACSLSEPRIPKYFSRDFMGFEDLMRTKPLFKEILASRNGVDRLAVAFRTFARDRHAKEIILVLPTINRSLIASLDRSVVLKMVHTALNFMSSDDVAKFKKAIKDAVDQKCLVLRETTTPMHVAAFMTQLHRSYDNVKDRKLELAHKLFFLLEDRSLIDKIVPAVSPLIVDGLIHRLFDEYVDESVRVIKARPEDFEGKPSEPVVAPPVDDPPPPKARLEAPARSHSFADDMAEILGGSAERERFKVAIDSFLARIPKAWVNTEITTVLVEELRLIGDDTDETTKNLRHEMIIRRLALHSEIISNIERGIGVFGVIEADNYDYALQAYKTFTEWSNARNYGAGISLKPLYLIMAEQAAAYGASIPNNRLAEFFSLYHDKKVNEVSRIFSRMPKAFRAAVMRKYISQTITDGLSGSLRAFSVLEKYSAEVTKRFTTIADKFDVVAEIFGLKKYATAEGFCKYLVQRDKLMSIEHILKQMLLGYMGSVAKERGVKFTNRVVVRKLSNLWRWNAVTVASALRDNIGR